MLSSPLEGTRKHEEILEYFTEINHSYSLRYDTTRVSFLAKKALQLCETEISGGLAVSDEKDTPLGECDYGSLVYLRLSRFLDESLSSSSLVTDDKKASVTDGALCGASYDILASIQNPDFLTSSFGMLHPDETLSNPANAQQPLTIGDADTATVDEVETLLDEEASVSWRHLHPAAENSASFEGLLNDLFQFGE
jgi:hypothetical protein